MNETEEFEEACGHDSCPVDGKCEHCKEPVKVARLKVPAPTVATDNSGEDWLGGPEPKDISDLESENKELLDIVHELFSQACYQHEQGAEYGMYDHMCISTYEEAQSLLIKHNRIKKEQCYRD